MSILTSEKVTSLFESSISENGVEVEGIMATVKLDVSGHEQEISELLSELPDTFRESVGGGWSFLNACMTRDGNQWGEHSNMEQLFMLGIAAGLAKWLMPRDMWKAFPGGMPYVSISV